MCNDFLTNFYTYKFLESNDSERIKKGVMFRNYKYLTSLYRELVLLCHILLYKIIYWKRGVGFINSFE